MAVLLVSGLGAAAFLAFVPQELTFDPLPSAAVPRFLVVALTFACFLLAASLVRMIRDAFDRHAASLALLGAATWFAFNVADLDHLLINRYGWPNETHPIFHVLEGVAFVVAGIATMLVSGRMSARLSAARGPL